MAAFFLLLAILLGVVLGDALVENDGTGALTLFGQTTERFGEGQLLLVFAGLGFLFALLLVLSLASTRRRRIRRREARSGRREQGERIAELERENARLQDDLARRDEALAGREAELAHRDRQLALKDEELARREHELVGPEQELARREEDPARREQEPHRAAAGGAQASPDDMSPTAVLDEPSAPYTEEPERTGTPRTEVVDAAAASPPEVVDQLEPVAPLHDEPPWLSEETADGTLPLAVSTPSEPDAADRLVQSLSGEGEEPTEPVDRGDAEPEPPKAVDRAGAEPAEAAREGLDDRPVRSRDEPGRVDG
jgi:hypothetical protein